MKDMEVICKKTFVYSVRHPSAVRLYVVKTGERLHKDSRTLSDFIVGGIGRNEVRIDLEEIKKLDEYFEIKPTDNK